MIINPDIFLLPKPPALIIWNYKSHEQFEIDKNHTTRLIELLENLSAFDQTNKIDTALLDAKILLDTPFTPDVWQWDVLSKIFHIGTKDLALEDIPQTSMEWAQHYLSQCDEAMNRAPPPPHRLENQPLENMFCLPSPSLNKTLEPDQRASWIATAGATLRQQLAIWHFYHLQARQNVVEISPLASL